MTNFKFLMSPPKADLPMAENQTSRWPIGIPTDASGQVSNSKYFLGVSLNFLPITKIQETVRDFLISGQHKIFTPNPEIVVKAQKDEYFKTILNSGDLNLCDGFGLSLFSGAPRITGADFLLEICTIAAEEGKSVYLLGSGSDKVVKKTAEELQKKFPKLRIVGVDAGPEISEVTCHSSPATAGEESLSQSSDGQGSFAPPQAGLKMTDNNDEVLCDIQSKQPDILFVAFGMGKQEKWIYENLARLPSVKIAMGVGGAFDYLAGAVPRAPRLMRALGLEWLYRLFRQPRRFKRIWNATVKFMIIYFSSKS